MFKRKFFFKLFLEIIAIVIGISASFGLNEISNKRDQEIQKERVLNSILLESNDIKKYCDDRMQIWNQDIDIYNLLLAQSQDLIAWNYFLYNHKYHGSEKIGLDFRFFPIL